MKALLCSISFLPLSLFFYIRSCFEAVLAKVHLAVEALVNHPVRAGLTVLASPSQQGIVGLDNRERVRAGSSHFLVLFDLTFRLI